jgi:hypothetical protein
MADITSSGVGEFSGSGACTTEPASTGITDAIKGKASELASGASQLYDDAKAKVGEWGAGVADAASSARESAQEAIGTVVEKGQNLEQEVASFIRRYPAACLLAGFGMGLLLAHATRRR